MATAFAAVDVTAATPSAAVDAAAAALSAAVDANLAASSTVVHATCAALLSAGARLPFFAGPPKLETSRPAPVHFRSELT